MIRPLDSSIRDQVLHDVRTRNRFPPSHHDDTSSNEENETRQSSETQRNTLYSARDLVSRFNQARMELPAPQEFHAPAGTAEGREARVRELEARDQLVRLHEWKHAAALGAYAGPIRYYYAAGPDGKVYVTGGYTEVNTMSLGDSELDLAKARMLRNAAFAGGIASGGDRAVAAQAQQVEQSILMEA